MTISLPAAAQVAQPYCPPNNLNPNCPNNVIEQKRQEEARRRAFEEAQRQAQIRAQQEAAQRAAMQRRAQQEAAQRAAQQRAQQEAAQRAAQQRAQEEARQRAEQQRAQQEAAQRAAQQRAQEEARQRAEQQRAQQEAAQRAAQQRAQQEAAQKAAQQRAQQEDLARKAAEQRATQQKAAQQRAQEDALRRAEQQKAAQRRAQEDAARQAAPKVVQKPAPTPVQQALPAAPKLAPQPAPGAPVQQALPVAPKPAPQPAPAAPVQQALPVAPKPAPQPAPAAPSTAPPPVASRQAVPPAAPSRPVALSSFATVVPQPDRSGYTINQKNPDGSNLVVRQTLLADGNRRVTAYRQIEDSRAGTSTRIYLNGHRVTVTPTFESRVTPSQTTFIRYHSGLRAATLPGGRPLYKEQFVTVRTGGVERQIIQRTVYMVPAGGRYVPVKTHVVQVYDVVQVYRRPVYVYRPVVFVPAFFVPFGVPFAAPLVVGPQCLVCPPPVVVFEAPPARYGNSFDLLADMQIAGPLVDDSVMPPQDSLPRNPAPAAGLALRNASPAPPDPELASLRSQVEDLQRQVDEKARENVDLQAALAQTSLQRTGMSEPASTAPFSASGDENARIRVPEQVREVMRKQVRLSVAQHQNGKPLLLSDVVDSGFARIYVFQAAAPIEVEDARTGAPCTLAAGDLTEFHKVPDGNGLATPMKVIASRPGRCEVNAVVHVKLEDLQEMLNAFNQRIEDNMKKLNSCLTSRGGCMRT